MFLTLLLIVTALPFSQNVSANESRYYNYVVGYTLTGNGANDMVAIANKQLNKTGSQLGYPASEGWCDNFVSDCAILCGQAKAVPQGGDVNDFLHNLTTAGATRVTTPKAGDIVIFYSGSSAAHAGLCINSTECISGNMSGSSNLTRSVKKYANASIASASGFSSYTYYRPKYATSGVVTTVTFNSNDGTGRSVKEQFVYGVSGQKFGYYFNGKARYNPMPAADVGFGQWVRDGYKLLGWSTDPNATTAMYPTYSGVNNNYISTRATDTLYAVWQQIEVPPTPTDTSTPTPTATSTPTVVPPTDTPTSTPTEVPSTPTPAGPTQVPCNSELAGFVERLYTVALGRESEIEGKNYWITALQNGATGAEAAHGFFFAPEVVDANLSNVAYVTRLYRTFMDREPDSDGLNFWINELMSGKSREEVFYGFINSTEWINICENCGINPGATTPAPSQRDAVVAFATRLYTTCLGRDGEAEGIEYWTDLLVSGTVTGRYAAHEFFFSGEFLDGNHNNVEFINRLYRTFMGREASSDELDYWVSALYNGGSREEIFNGFATSPEFADLCRAAGITP